MRLNIKKKIDYYFGYLLVILFIPPTRFLGVFLNRNHSVDNSNPKNIIFIKMLGMGSVIIGSNAINSLKNKYPDSKITLICGPSLYDGLINIGLFDQILVINDKNFFSILKSSIKTLFTIWKMKKRWVLDLEVYSKLTTIFSLLTASYNRFGFYLSEVRFRYSLNTHNIYFNQFCAVEENYNTLVQAAGVTNIEPFEFKSYGKHNRVNEKSKKYISINNTCSDLSLERKIPVEKLKTIIINLLHNSNYDIVLLGAPNDRKNNEIIVSELGSDRLSSIAGKLAFDQYYQFLFEECVCLLTIDSAPLHIAMKIGLPTLSLWGPTSPTSYINSDERNIHYYLKKNCSPCIHHTEILPCGGDNICMKDMEEKQIITLLNTLIESLK